MITQDLGIATAYGYAKSKGYTGTEAEFAELMASYATVGQTAVDAKDAAVAAKTAAQTAATTATNKASEATTAATTATNKAAEAQADADAAALDASQAMSAASTATTKATEATTAAATAVSAKDDAVSANTAAQSAKTAAQTAQTGAETAAASVQSSAAQIATNTEDIESLKSEFTALTNESNESVCDIAYNKDQINIPLTWTVGGISSGTGEETDNTSYRRTGFIEVPQGRTVYITFPVGIRVYRNIYYTNKSFRTTTQMNESGQFSFTGDWLVRFSLIALSGYEIPTDINAVVNVSVGNVVKTEVNDLKEYAKTIGNGVDGTNAALRAAVKSINLYGFDNKYPCYFGLLRKNYQSSGKTVFNIYQNGVYEIVTLPETTGTVHYHIDKDSSGISGDLLSGIKSIDITIDLDELADPTDYSLNSTTGRISADNVFIYEYPDIGADTAIETYPYLGLLGEETIENTTITDLTDLSGKTCYLVGDSMTAAGTLDTYLNQRLGLVCTNYGVGGCTIAINDATMTGKSIVERVLGTGTSDNIVGSGDIWVVWGGYNDASYRNTPLGDIYSTDNATLYGALKTICKTIQEKTNNPRILLVTMHQSSNRMLTAPGRDGKGEFIRDMREAFYQVGELFGIPVCDLYKYGGISPVNNLQMTSDGVHLNTYGKQFIYPKIANAIKEMI